MKFYYQTGVFVPFAQKHYKQFILAIAAVFMASFGLMTLNAKAATTEVITPVNQQGWTSELPLQTLGQVVPLNFLRILARLPDLDPQL